MTIFCSPDMTLHNFAVSTKKTKMTTISGCKTLDTLTEALSCVVSAARTGALEGRVFGNPDTAWLYPGEEIHAVYTLSPNISTPLTKLFGASSGSWGFSFWCGDITDLHTFVYCICVYIDAVLEL